MLILKDEVGKSNQDVGRKPGENISVMEGKRKILFQKRIKKKSISNAVQDQVGLSLKNIYYNQRVVVRSW